MATLTIEISDQLAAKLQPHQNQLEQLLYLGLQRLSPAENPLYDEVLSFLASGPNTAEISEIRPSPAAQERIRILLDKNRQNSLTQAESAELEQVQAINHLMTLIKLKAKKQLSSAE